jgi:hypothetical protein
VSAQAHALLQDARGTEAIDDNLGADRIGVKARRQILAAVAELRVLANRLQSVVDLVAVRQPTAAGRTFRRGSAGCR